MRQTVTLPPRRASMSLGATAAALSGLRHKLDVRDTGYTQSFNVSIDKAWIIAEEEFLSRSVGSVVRLALEKLTGDPFRLRALADKSQRGS